MLKSLGIHPRQVPRLLTRDQVREILAMAWLGKNGHAMGRKRLHVLPPRTDSHRT